MSPVATHRDETLSSLRRGLEKKRRRIAGILVGDNEEIKGMAQEDATWADMAAASGQRDQVAAEAEGLRAQLVAIDQALARAKSGTYGMCVECGRPIAANRLRAIPVALRDTECQAVFERRGR